MSMISFSWTTAALCAGAKSVTRRDWNHGYAKQFIAAFHRGEPVTAYDKSPRNFGKPVATILLTQPPAIEPNSKMPDSDYAAEGFEFAFKTLGDTDRSWEAFEEWRSDGGRMYVVRFKLIEVNAYGHKLLDRILKKSARPMFDK